MNRFLLFALPLLVAGCLEAPATPDAAPMREANVDAEPAPPSEPEPAPRASDQYGFILNVIPRTEEEPWTFVTVGTLSTSGNRTPVHNGLNATVVLLGWDVTEEIYADTLELEAAFQAHNDTLGYLRASFWGSGGVVEFPIPSAVENRTLELRPVVSMVLVSPQSDSFIAATLDGGIYKIQSYTVIEDNKATEVSAWTRQEDFGVMDAPHAEEERKEEAPRE